MEQQVEGWLEVVREGQVMLERTFQFKTFGSAMQFTV